VWYIYELAYIESKRKSISLYVSYQFVNF